MPHRFVGTRAGAAVGLALDRRSRRPRAVGSSPRDGGGTSSLTPARFDLDVAPPARRGGGLLEADFSFDGPAGEGGVAGEGGELAGGGQADLGGGEADLLEQAGGDGRLGDGAEGRRFGGGVRRVFADEL